MSYLLFGLGVNRFLLKKMLFCILFLLMCGTCDGCTFVGQVCYKCRGDIYTCNDGSYFSSTPEECISSIMASSTKLSAHYKPYNQRCFPYTCTDNMYFSDSTRFTIRKTCNNDCTNFTLASYSNTKVTNTLLSSATKSIGQCFEDCFETIGCYTFSFASFSSVCSIYTSCGTSCASGYEFGTTTYTRTCHTASIDCGLLNNQSNGAVDISAGTTYQSLATYKCSDGYTLYGTSTRTCQANGQWSGSEPGCIPVDCGSLMSPSNVIVIATNGTTYSNQAVYTCETGYMVVGNAFRTCLSNGQWSGSEPWCFPTGMPISEPDKIYIAPCICHANKTFANLTQEEIIRYLIKETIIEKNSTALARRKLTCANDQRFSSKVVGYTGICAVTGVLLLTLLLDVLTFCKEWDETRGTHN